jgi:hypothetical protein
MPVGNDKEGIPMFDASTYVSKKAKGLASIGKVGAALDFNW